MNRLFVAVAMTAILVMACAKGANAAEGIEPKQQASNLAVPDADPYKPTAAILVLLCKRAIALGFVDSEGGYHNQPLEGLTPAIIADLLSQVDASKVTAYVIPCGSTDGTPL